MPIKSAAAGDTNFSPATQQRTEGINTCSFQSNKSQGKPRGLQSKSATGQKCFRITISCRSGAEQLERPKANGLQGKLQSSRAPGQLQSFRAIGLQSTRGGTAARLRGREASAGYTAPAPEAQCEGAPLQSSRAEGGSRTANSKGSINFKEGRL